MRSGEVVTVDFGVPTGTEPGFARPAVVVTADAVLDGRPRTIHVVPLTGNLERRLPTEVVVHPAGLDRPSAAQCHLCSLVSVVRVTEAGTGATIGAVALAQVRSVVADLLDLD